MRVLIVDDEPPARNRLASLLSELKAGDVVGEAADGRQALELVTRRRPDVLLLDIRMPGMDGLEVAGHLAALEHPPAVIFTTAYDQHALEAFEARAVDYLLKPVRRDRLQKAIERASRLTQAQLKALGQNNGARTHISATMHGNLSLVPVEDIRYFQADQKYVTVAHPGGQVLIEESLRTLENEFGERLLRVHRNALVAVSHVAGPERGTDGRHQVRFKGMEQTLEVSRRLLTGVKKRLKGL